VRVCPLDRRDREVGEDGIADEAVAGLHGRDVVLGQIDEPGELSLKDEDRPRG
jgi:hypothetical protein